MADVAGTVAITEITFGTIKKIKAEWVSGQGAHEGTASGTTPSTFDGRILGAITVPSGTAAPDDNYDIDVKDDDDVDVALNSLHDRDTANTEFVKEADMAAVAHSTLTIEITHAGSAKEGTLILFIR